LSKTKFCLCLTTILLSCNVASCNPFSAVPSIPVPKLNVQTLPSIIGVLSSNCATPVVTLAVTIAPLDTLSIVIVTSFVLVAPPRYCPSITIVSPCAYPPPPSSTITP